jgi:hypothetical protein
MKNTVFENANIAAFKADRYVNNLWKIFVSADILYGALIDLKKQMEGLGDYRFDDKRNIETAISSSFKTIEGIGKICTQDFNSMFGDISDEVKTLIESYIVNKHTTLFKEPNIKVNDFYKNK